MIVVKISYLGDFPLIRQLPKGNPEFGNIQFVINQDIPECDYWFVFDSIEKEETTKCDPKNVYLTVSEPASVRYYNSKYLNQFASVVTVNNYLNHKNKILIQPMLFWMVGINFDREKKKFIPVSYWEYDDFRSASFEDKKKLISIISSNKNFTSGHKRRLKFIEAIQNEFGDDLEIFGNGFNDIPDKMDALKDFKYSIVIENSQHKDYWTEKLADAFLCNCYPIYFGCSNIYDYFSKDSLTVIDISKPEESVSRIREVIDKDYYSKHKSDIAKSKQSVMLEYNFFYFLKDKIIQAEKGKKELITLYPEKTNIFDKIKTKIYRHIL